MVSGGRAVGRWPLGETKWQRNGRKYPQKTHGWWTSTRGGHGGRCSRKSNPRERAAVAVVAAAAVAVAAAIRAWRSPSWRLANGRLADDDDGAAGKVGVGGAHRGTVAPLTERITEWPTNECRERGHRSAHRRTPTRKGTNDERKDTRRHREVEKKGQPVSGWPTGDFIRPLMVSTGGFIARFGVSGGWCYKLAGDFISALIRCVGWLTGAVIRRWGVG